jgi:hypothetical protein
MELYFSPNNRRLFSACVLLLLIGLTAGCLQNDNKEQKKKEAKCQCDTTKTFVNLDFFLSGYDFSEVDTVIVKEVSSTNSKDTVSKIVLPKPFDKDSKNYFLASCKGTFPIADQFIIQISGEPEHVMRNIKMGVITLSNMTGEDYSCAPVSFDLDGKTYGDESITFYKK